MVEIYVAYGSFYNYNYKSRQVRALLGIVHQVTMENKLRKCF